MPYGYPDGTLLPTVGEIVNDPTYIKAKIDLELSNAPLISEQIFRREEAPSGTVVYDYVKGLNQVETRVRDVEDIEPGDEFPLIDLPGAEQLPARTQKFGGRFEVTREAVKQNKLSDIDKGTRQLVNLIRQKNNRNSVNALTSNTDVQALTAGAAWGTGGGDPYADLLRAKSLGDDDELGYELDTVLVNRNDYANILLSPSFRSAVQGTDLAARVVQGQAVDILGFTYIPNTQIPKGTVYVLQSQISGVDAVHEDTSVDSIEDRTRQVWNVLGWRNSRPLITDPLSIVKLQGV